MDGGITAHRVQGAIDYWWCKNTWMVGSQRIVCKELSITDDVRTHGWCDHSASCARSYLLLMIKEHIDGVITAHRVQGAIDYWWCKNTWMVWSQRIVCKELSITDDIRTHGWWDHSASCARSYRLLMIKEHMDGGITAHRVQGAIDYWW
jgi:hypothetical protein